LTRTTCLEEGSSHVAEARVPALKVRARVEEEAAALLGTRRRGTVKWSALGRFGAVHKGTVTEEEGYHLGVVALRCEMKGRVSV